MEFSELTLLVHDNTVLANRDDGAQARGQLMLDELHRNLISLFKDWLSLEKQNGENRKLTRRREFEVFGSLLYRTLFNGEVEFLFERSMSEIKDDERLRVQLSFEGKAGELASIPWEYLYRPDTEYRQGFFLATNSHLVLSRYLPLDLPEQSLAPEEGPLKILFVTSKPPDLEAVLSDGVIEIIEELAKTYPITINTLNSPTFDDFLDKLGTIKPHVLHFIGHGQFNREKGEGEIALLNSDEVSARWVGDREFTESLAHSHAIPRLAFLQLCEGGAVDFTANFAGLAPQLMRGGSQAVVAMQYPISNTVALIFSRSFYRELAKGGLVDAAVQEGRFRITMNDSKAFDSRIFGVPVLYMRSRNAIILPLATSVPTTDR